MSDQWQPDPRQQQPQYLPPWQPQQGYQPPPQQPYQQPPRPRSRRGLACLGCGGLGAIVVLIAVIAASHSSSSSPPAALPTLQTVAPATLQAAAPSTAAAAQVLTYYVSGSPADVTYGPTGTNVAGTVPMSVSGPLGSPLYYHITAQLQGSGAVTCKLEINGKVISQATASGGYNIAMCEISRDPLTGAWQDTNG